jgi:hypothetical protein
MIFYYGYHGLVCKKNLKTIRGKSDYLNNLEKDRLANSKEVNNLLL